MTGLKIHELLEVSEKYNQALEFANKKAGTEGKKYIKDISSPNDLQRFLKIEKLKASGGNLFIGLLVRDKQKLDENGKLVEREHRPILTKATHLQGKKIDSSVYSQDYLKKVAKAEELNVEFFLDDDLVLNRKPINVAVLYQLEKKEPAKKKSKK